MTRQAAALDQGDEGVARPEEEKKRSKHFEFVATRILLISFFFFDAGTIFECEV